MAKVVKCGTCGKRRKRAVGCADSRLIGLNGQFRVTVGAVNVMPCEKCREAILEAAAQAAVEKLDDLLIGEN